MLDGITRWILLAGCVFIIARGIWLLPQTTLKVRRIAVWSMLPPAAVWTAFYIDNLITHPFDRGGLSRLAWLSRGGVFLTLVAWYVKQEVIRIAERSTRALNDD